jgi:hypothetical protein
MLKPLIVAAAFAAAASTLAVAPPASADPCAQFLQIPGVSPNGKSVYQTCQEGVAASQPRVQQSQAPQPNNPSGPCTANPALGINGTCGEQFGQAGDCLLTGVCPAGSPPSNTGPLPAQPPPTAPMMPVMPAGPPPPGPQAPPLDPGQCADVAYFTAHNLACAQVAPTPPGWVPGQSS